MTYRLATVNDVEAINKLCDAEGLERPTLQHCHVAVENGNIVGYVNAMVVPLIDTVCTNPIAAKTLNDRMCGHLSGIGFATEFMFTKREDVKSVAKKYGFVQIREGVDVYAKEI